jgi:hypothetical protein
MTTEHDADEENDAPGPRDEHAPPVRVAAYSTAGEAEVAAASLRADGIESAIVDSIEGGALPVLGEPGVLVEVHPDDVDSALRLLDDDGAALTGG